MNQATAVRARRAAQLILLLCTVMGLALMHTLGHGSGGHGHSGSPPGHGSTAAEPVVVPGEAVGGGCGDCAHGSAPADDDGGMPGWQICLAVLSVLTVVVLLAALLVHARRSGRRAPARRRGLSWQVQRAPPPSFGRQTVCVSVLRI